MIEIHGKSDSLKKVHSVLMERGFTEFHSIKQVNQFARNYDQRINSLREEANQIINEEIKAIEKKRFDIEENHLLELRDIDNEVGLKLDLYDKRIKYYRHRAHDPIFRKAYTFIQRQYLKFRISKYEKGLRKTKETIAKRYDEQIVSVSNKVLNYTTNFSHIVDQKIASEVERLNRIRQTIKEINPLIAGAIGEHKVIKCLDQLSVEGVLINDYKLHFSPPIFYKKDKTRIHSIQLDHLLITKAGLFLIETKNWSKESINSHDLRSPVSQINRSSYALFRFFNDSKNVKLEKHHWGEKEIAIRNLIVMITHKPKANFKYVKVKLLNELNSYIEHFADELTSSEVRTIADFLLLNQDENSKYTKSKTASKPRVFKTINEMYQDK